jgi:hypothetical protein
VTSVRDWEESALSGWMMRVLAGRTRGVYRQVWIHQQVLSDRPVLRFVIEQTKADALSHWRGAYGGADPGRYHLHLDRLDHLMPYLVMVTVVYLGAGEPVWR